MGCVIKKTSSPPRKMGDFVLHELGFRILAMFFGHLFFYASIIIGAFVMTVEFIYMWRFEGFKRAATFLVIMIVPVFFFSVIIGIVFGIMFACAYAQIW